MSDDRSRRDVFVSVVIVLSHSEPDLESFLEDLARRMSADFTEHEILLVCDRYSESIITRIEAVLPRIPRIRTIILASRCSEEVGIACGMENAIGDFVVNLDMRRDPPDRIRDGVEMCMAGSDIVVGVSDVRESLPYRVGSALFHSLFARAAGYQYPRKGTSFLFMSRRSINAVTRVRKFDHRLIARIYSCGYPMHTMRYQAAVDFGGKRTLTRGMQNAYQTVIFNSLKPLRFIGVLGLFASFCAFLFALYSIIVNLVKAHVQEGWTTQVLFTSAMFFFLFLVLSVLGEYVARLIDESNTGSDYDVLAEKHSATMIDPERRNVYRESEADRTNLVQTGRDQ